MSWEQSDGEGSGIETGTDRFVDASAETEVELRLPPEVVMEPDQIRKDVSIYPGSTTWTLLVLIRKRNVDLDPRMWPNRSVPDMGCHCPALRSPVGFYRGPGTTGRIRRWSGHVCNAQPDVSGNGPAPTGRQSTAGETNTRSVCSWVTDPGTPEFR